TDAWVPVAEKSGVDVPLLMMIRNDSSSPRRVDAGQVRGREFFGKAYRRSRRRGARDARDRIYPARSRQHRHAQARRISRDVAADGATDSRVRSIFKRLER